MYGDTILAKLKPLNLECGSPIGECMAGTRGDILSVILDWAVDINAPNIFWLEGYPGIGKSAIATTLVENFRKSNRLGSSFFFRRELANAMTVNALWRTVAHDLGRRYPSIRKHLIAKMSANDNIITTTNVDTLFNELIHEASVACDQMSTEESPIIVIDALDECGGLDGQHSVQRINMMRTLKTWSTLPKTFKLLVTSRHEPDIAFLFANTNHRSLEIPTGDGGYIYPNNDIEKFLEYHFGRIAAQYENALPAGWPGYQVIKQLVKMSNGIFIYVVTILKILSQGEPREQLSRILAGAGAGGLTTLYSWILRTSFSDPSEKVVESLHSIVGTIILAKDPLLTSSIGELCSIDYSAVKYILNGLQSVMYTGEIPRFKHQSFVDFLTDKTRFPSVFLIDLKHERRSLAIKGLRVMKKHLHFNICELKSSYDRNSDIPDLEIRIGRHLTPHVCYSAVFWASHLADISFDHEIFDLLQDFMQNRFLFWLEVLSLTKRVNIGSGAMQSLIDWLRVGNQDDHMAKDMKEFLATFGGAISQSAPHIYVSALPLMPRNSAIWKQYIGRYPRTINVRCGGQMEWSAIQNMLMGHTDYVNCVAFSPDGRCIVSGSRDTTIRVWDAETGEVVTGPFKGHTDSVNSVEFSPDGRRIVSGSQDATIRVWDTETGELVAGPFKWRTHSVSCVAFSPNGRCIVSGSRDWTVRVWDAETGEVVTGPFEGHTDWVNCVTFSPDGRRIASGSHDRTARVWDVWTGKVIAGPFEGHTDSVNSIAFSPDGRRIVSGSRDWTVQVWDAKTGEVVTGPFKGHTDWVNCVAFSPNGKKIVSGSYDRTVRVWNAKTGKLVTGPFDGHTDSVNSVCFSPDGRRIVSGSRDRVVRVWDAEMGRLVASPLKGHTDWVNSVGFSADGRRIVSGSYDRTVRVWNAKTGKAVAGPFEGHTHSVNSVAFLPNGRCIISGSTDRTIRVWDAKTGKMVAGPFEGHTHSANSMAFSPDGRRIFSGSYDRTVQVWDAETGEVVVGPFEGHTDWVNSVAFSPDGRCIVSGSYDGTVQVWDAENGEAVAGPFKGRTHSVNCVAFSPNGRSIVTGSIDKTVQVWSVETGEVVAGPFKGHTSWVNSVAFSPDGRCIVSGSHDTTVRVWDAETGEVVAGPFEGHTHSVNCVAFSPNGRRIVSASDDTMLRVWNLKACGFLMCLLHFTNSSRMVDGWMLGPKSELLFWVPPTLRTGLWRPGNTAIIGKLVTKLGFGNFAHGEFWTNCANSGGLEIQ
ncbi:hypothetical protein M408DRAFT_324867 [Serendipita vermifera MAFF 305830]|uniref:Uncharacterized protein n=1 Tax=Serendipita vermifera MAFF 305830 TaxID=933852 RepID=A0A0C2WWM5_SERVB|nr:hypothetical protein M408DRAFT_324867 [Serendipita vermifera MAFF 305830]